jgi:hypothetical protein
MAVLLRCRAASESGETERLASLRGVSDRAVLGHTPHSQEWLCYGNGCAAEWLRDCGCLARGAKGFERPTALQKFQQVADAQRLTGFR